MKLTEAIYIAFITVVGSSLASYLTGRASSESARIQAEASLKAATSQVEAARNTSRSDAAMKLMAFRAEPMGGIYEANSKLQAAAFGSEMNQAAKQLAVAAAAGAARLDGKAGSLCLEIVNKANFFASIPDPMLTNKADARGDLARQMVELKFEFEKMQAQAVGVALFEPTAK